MTTRHPFTWIDIQVQKVAFWPLLVFALLLMAVQQVLGKPLITPAAPSGIVSFELAGSLPNAREMLESWGPTGRVYAASVWAQTICSLSPILSPFLSDAFWLHVASCSDQAIYLALGLSSPGLSSARRLRCAIGPTC
jgi:hypothetical protein